MSLGEISSSGLFWRAEEELIRALACFVPPRAAGAALEDYRDALFTEG